MDVLSTLKAHPERYATLMGFRPLNEVQSGWLRSMLFGNGDHTLQAFRGSAKTTCVSIALALNLILRPNETTLFMRKTDTDTAEVMRQVERMVRDDSTRALARMIWGVPVSVVRSNQGEIHTNLSNSPRGTSQLIGMGIGSSLTGKHFDRIFTDDIVNPKDRTSRAERERTKLAYMELQNVKNRGGRIFNTGTPWHAFDCFSIMPEAERWDYRSMPDVFTEQDAEEIRKRMTPSLWAANYELRHIPSDDVIFTDPKTGADISLVMQGQCHVDAAYYGEDFTAFTAMNVHDGIRYVYGRMWRKHVDDVTDLIVADYERLKLGKMYMEKNADKGYASKAFRAKGVRTVDYTEKMQKFLKITTYLKTAWPDIVFVEGTDEAFVNQIVDYTEDAEHDDAPDSLASCIQHARFSKPYRSPFK